MGFFPEESRAIHFSLNRIHFGIKIMDSEKERSLFRIIRRYYYEEEKLERKRDQSADFSIESQGLEMSFGHVP